MCIVFHSFKIISEDVTEWFTNWDFEYVFYVNAFSLLSQLVQLLPLVGVVSNDLISMRMQ